MSERIAIEPMPVTRIETDGASHVEPPFNQDWPAETKIAWKLGCLHTDTGYTNLHLYFHKTNWSISAPGISMGGGIGSPRHDLNGIWHALNWIEFGIKAAQNGRQP